MNKELEVLEEEVTGLVSKLSEMKKEIHKVVDQYNIQLPICN